jgi:hypothetical protein
LAEQEIKQIGEGESPAEYTRERAIQSFQQIVEIHGWQVAFSFSFCRVLPCFLLHSLQLVDATPLQNAPEFPGGAAKKKP